MFDYRLFYLLWVTSRGGDYATGVLLEVGVATY